MEAYITIILVVLAGVAGFLLKDKAAKRDEVKQKVKDAAVADEEGAINASLEFAERVKAAEEAVDAAIDARPVTGDPAADLADRIGRSRRQRRARRQRASSDDPAD
jgi:hypothetical protein